MLPKLQTKTFLFNELLVKQRKRTSQLLALNTCSQPYFPTPTPCHQHAGSLILIGCKLGRTAALPIIALKAGAEPYRFLITRQICAWGTRRAIHFSIWFPARDKLTDVDWFPFLRNREPCLHLTARPSYLSGCSRRMCILISISFNWTDNWQDG